MFIKQAENTTIEDELKAKLLQDALAIAQGMQNVPEAWEQCRFNIEDIGEALIKGLREFKANDSNELQIDRVFIIDHVFILLFRFLCEREFFLSNDVSIAGLDYIKGSIKKNLYEMMKKEGAEHALASNIFYALYIMPASIAGHALNHPDLEGFKKFESNLAELKTQKDKLETQKKEVTQLKHALESYQTGFNFVGLNQGFRNMSEQKKSEAFGSLVALLIMVPVIIFPLASIFWLFITKTITSVGIDYLFISIPIFSIEMILIYFFRVILFNYRSVKAQLMQLELRQALCQFIQSYADYSSKIKEKDKNALEKFENIIFSGIISNSEKLPSTFDGVEQILKILKNIKNS